MPYASDAQRRFMHAKHPGIAARWDREEHMKKSNHKAALDELGRRARVMRHAEPDADESGGPSDADADDSGSPLRDINDEAPRTDEERRMPPQEMDEEIEPRRRGMRR